MFSSLILVVVRSRLFLSIYQEVPLLLGKLFLFTVWCWKEINEEYYLFSFDFVSMHHNSKSPIGQIWCGIQNMEARGHVVFRKSSFIFICSQQHETLSDWQSHWLFILPIQTHLRLNHQLMKDLPSLVFIFSSSPSTTTATRLTSLSQEQTVWKILGNFIKTLNYHEFWEFQKILISSLNFQLDARF